MNHTELKRRMRRIADEVGLGLRCNPYGNEYLSDMLLARIVYHEEYGAPLNGPWEAYGKHGKGIKGPAMSEHDADKRCEAAMGGVPVEDICKGRL